MKFLKCKQPPSEKTGKKIAIIGAGPGGLTAAGILICKGHEVVVYDMLPEPGGMLLFGIPDVRMNKDPIVKGIKELEEVGVKFVLNTKVGKDISFDDILKEYDAILIATGAWKDINLGLPGEDAKQVLHAVDFLSKVALVKRGHLPKSELPKIGRKVVVIGGGDTAVDAAWVAKDMGADVTIAYRRTREMMPAKPHSVDLLEKMDVKFIFLVSPSRVLLNENGDVVGLECDKMKLGEPDASGRPRPIPTGEKINIECDTIIFAIGEIATPPFEDPEKYGIKVDRKNRIQVNEKYMTSRPGVFAVGDVVTGPKNIASAIKAAVTASNAIHEYLSG